MTTFLDLSADRIPLKVRGERDPVGFAYGSENWLRSAAFICERGSRTAPPPHLRYWGLSVADLDSYDRRGLGPSLADIAHGTSGCGEDSE